MKIPKSLDKPEGIRKLTWHVERMIEDPDYGQESNWFGGFSIWDVYRTVADELDNSITRAKLEGKRTGKKWRQREIVAIIKWLKSKEYDHLW
jgi:hypothetical protein